MASRSGTILLTKPIRRASSAVIWLPQEGVLLHLRVKQAPRRNGGRPEELRLRRRGQHDHEGQPDPPCHSERSEEPALAPSPLRVAQAGDSFGYFERRVSQKANSTDFAEQPYVELNPLSGTAGQQGDQTDSLSARATFFLGLPPGYNAFLEG